MNNEDRRGVCFYRGRMPRVFWGRAPGRQGGGAKSRAGLFERRGFPQRQVAYSQTIDDVYLGYDKSGKPNIGAALRKLKTFQVVYALLLMEKQGE